MARIPLFIWDPRSAAANVRRESLVQNIDLAPTLLDYFNLAPAPDMRGRNLAGAIADGRPARTAALFGHHGGHVNCTDGQELAALPCNDERKLVIAEAIHAETAMRLDWIREVLKDGARAYCSQLIGHHKSRMKNSLELWAKRVNCLRYKELLTDPIFLGKQYEQTRIRRGRAS